MAKKILQPIEECFPARQRARLEQPLGTKKTILIVEADVVLLDTIVDILRWAGYETLAAHTSSEAISICERSSLTIDLFLSECNLPGGNGVELAKCVTGLRPGLPVIFMSGNRTASQNLRANGYIVLEKPFSFAELTSLAREILGAGTIITALPKQATRASMQ